MKPNILKREFNQGENIRMKILNNIFIGVRLACVVGVAVALCNCSTPGGKGKSGSDDGIEKTSFYDVTSKLDPDGNFQYRES